MEPSTEEKVWTVIKAVADAYEIAPLQGKIILPLKPLTKTIDTVELSQLLKKFEQDNEIIKIHSRPDDLSLGEDAGCYLLTIPDPIKFREFLNRAHARHSGDINRLEANNFLAVSEVAMDILAALQISNGEEVRIQLMPDIIRYPALMPGDGINMRDRYCQYRWDALTYLKDRKHILDFEIIRSDHRWQQKVKVVVDRYDFDKFYKKLGDAYERRIVEPSKEKEKKSKKEASQPSPIQLQALPPNLSVQLKDREIWINDFLLSKPHAVGGNKGFFEYVYENANQPLDRDQMPEYVTQDVKGKSFSKVLNELGFKGQILKAFFPERGKSKLSFRNEVSAEQLEKDGVNSSVLLQELQLAHTKNSPK